MTGVVAAWLILAAPTAEIEVEGEPTPTELRAYRRLSAERGGYARVLVTSGFGRGLRFNNPFRLATQLGDTEQSLSLTAPYHDVGLGLVFGDPDGLQHGGALRLSVALEGVPQQALGVSYLTVYRDPDFPVMGFGRLGVSILAAPDPNAGGELALGAAAFFTGGVGLQAELVGNLFYGAGSLETQYTVIPVLSLQGGIIIDFEVLP